MASPNPKNVFAFVVAVDKYHDQQFPHLQFAVSDAKKLVRFLRDELDVPPDHLKTMYNDEAEKHAIINFISKLPANPAFDPGDALLFYFAGIAGKAKEEQSSNETGGDKPQYNGIICPVDVNTGNKTGISDATLTRFFHQISTSHGCNITILLDCDSGLFSWKDPTSFVAISPEDATETETGGGFTDSIVTVLRQEKEANRLGFLTVQSMADRAQVVGDIGPIHCFGQRVNRLLFDGARGSSYHSFIRVQKEVGGKIKLYAGHAQGIQPGMKLAVFDGNVKDTANRRRGYLLVNSVGSTTSILRRDLIQTSLPTVFYASDTQYAGKNLKVLIKGLPDHADRPEWLRIAQEVTASDRPHISVSFNNDNVSFIWQGLENDSHIRGRYPAVVRDLSMTKDRNQIAQMLANAARFTYHLSWSCLAQSSLVHGLGLEMKGSDKGDTNLLENGCVTLALEEKESPACHLTIHNSTGVDLWPHVYAFDPECFSTREPSTDSTIEG